MTLPWKPDDVQRMMTMLANGASMREVGEVLGRTRNAVIGACQRERIKQGHVPQPLKRVLGGAAKPVRPVPSTPSGVGAILPAIAPPPRTGPAVGLLDVTGCKWPVAEDASLIGGHAFCNHPKGDNQPYCPYHVQASIAPYSAELKRRTFKSMQFILKRAA
jgi:hypothetical protein